VDEEGTYAFAYGGSLGSAAEAESLPPLRDWLLFHSFSSLRHLSLENLRDRWEDISALLPWEQLISLSITHDGPMWKETGVSYFSWRDLVKMIGACGNLERLELDIRTEGPLSLEARQRYGSAHEKLRRVGTPSQVHVISPKLKYLKIFAEVDLWFLRPLLHALSKSPCEVECYGPNWTLYPAYNWGDVMRRSSEMCLYRYRGTVMDMELGDRPNK
jgi:hypothetical protein